MHVSSMHQAVFAGLVGNPTGDQLEKVLNLLDVHDSVILVTRKSLNEKLRDLIIGYGFGHLITDDINSKIDSLYVFDDADTNDLLQADRKSIPIYSSRAFLNAA